MKKGKRSFARGRHREIGRALYDANTFLTRLYVEVANTYGASSRASKSVHKAGEALSQARCDLDSVMADETITEWQGGVLRDEYYPGMTEGRTKAEEAEA